MFSTINMLHCCYWQIRPSEGMIAPLDWINIKSGSVCLHRAAGLCSNYAAGGVNMQSKYE